MTFRVGQKVVCIDDYCGQKFLKTGSVYTVLAIDGPFLEIDCKPTDRGCRGWFASRFRPVVERKTDISIFKRMLNPTSKKTEPA